MYFDEISKLKRTKKMPLLVRQFKEKRTVKTMAPCEEGLPSGAEYKYQIFPKFDKGLFYIPRQVENYNSEAELSSLLKSLITNDQLSKMNDSDWARYLSETIYLLWFHIFATSLPLYQSHAKDLIFFAKRLLEHVVKKLSPLRDIELIYRRLFEACGRCRLQPELQELFQEMKRGKVEPDKVTFGTYYQSFLLSKKPLGEQPLLKRDSYLKVNMDEFEEAK